jgi:hypothetical protein
VPTNFEFSSTHLASWAEHHAGAVPGRCPTHHPRDPGQSCGRKFPADFYAGNSATGPVHNFFCAPPAPGPSLKFFGLGGVGGGRRFTAPRPRQRPCEGLRAALRALQAGNRPDFGCPMLEPGFGGSEARGGWLRAAEACPRPPSLGSSLVTAPSGERQRVVGPGERSRLRLPSDHVQGEFQNCHDADRAENCRREPAHRLLRVVIVTGAGSDREVRLPERRREACASPLRTPGRLRSQDGARRRWPQPSAPFDQADRVSAVACVAFPSRGHLSDHLALRRWSALTRHRYPRDGADPMPASRRRGLVSRRRRGRSW